MFQVNPSKWYVCYSDNPYYSDKIVLEFGPWSTSKQAEQFIRTKQLRWTSAVSGRQILKSPSVYHLPTHELKPGLANIAAELTAVGITFAVTTLGDIALAIPMRENDGREVETYCLIEFNRSCMHVVYREYHDCGQAAGGVWRPCTDLASALDQIETHERVEREVHLEAHPERWIAPDGFPTYHTNSN